MNSYGNSMQGLHFVEGGRVHLVCTVLQRKRAKLSILETFSCSA